MSPSIPNLDEMEEVSETHDADKDLLYMRCVQPVKVYVHDDVYELIGEISSRSDESEVSKDGELESYLTSVINSIPNSQGMAKTKQMARKTEKRGLPLALGRDQQQCQQTTPPELDSNSSLEREYHSTSMGSKGGTPVSHGRRGRSAGPVPVRSRDRKRRLETDDESSEKESSEESSEESTSQPPAKKPKGKNARQQLKTKPLRKQKPRKHEDDMTAHELIAHWN